MPCVARKNQRPRNGFTVKFLTGGIGGQVSPESISPDASASSSIGSRVHGTDGMGADLRGLFSRDMLAIEQRTGTGACRRGGGRCPVPDGQPPPQAFLYPS